MESELAYIGPVVAFDLDDTLFSELDFLKSGFKAVASFLEERQGFDSRTLLSEMLVERKQGKNAFDYLNNKYCPTDKQFITKAVDLYRFHKPEIGLSDYAQDLLENLTEKGVRLALITDGRSKTQRNKIEALGILRFFPPENILISEELGTEKTSITAWQTIVRKYPNASRFIYIGDNPAKDFKIPNMLGWLTIGLKDKGKNIHSQSSELSPVYAPSLWIDSLSEVEDIIVNISSNT